MGRIFLIIVFTCILIGARSQNLVPNYSFEQYDTCPYSSSQIKFATPWFQPNFGGIGGSTDYYNICDSFNLWAGIPYNNLGYQHAKTGVAYTGIGVSYNDGLSNGREYLEVKLTDALIAGKKYCIQFYVSLADKSKYAIDAIGVYFSVDSALYYSNDFSYMPVQPQFVNSGNIISDTSNWSLISGEIIANGGEEFITIGNFYPDSLTSVDTLSGTWPSYYYIDDISVYLCDCDTTPPVAKFNYTSDTLTATFNNLSSAFSNYWFWDFGDGNTDTTYNPGHTYDSAGIYTVTLVAWYNGCSDTMVAQVAVNDVGIKQFMIYDSGFRIFPNPASWEITISVNTNNADKDFILVISDITGRKLKEYIFYKNEFVIPIDGFDNGVYYLRLYRTNFTVSTAKLYILK